MRIFYPSLYPNNPLLAGFSAMEITACLALFAILTALGFKSWQHHHRGSELKSEISLIVQRTLQNARQHAQTEGTIVAWRFERETLLLEINESAFSTRWMTIFSVDLPDDWLVIEKTAQRLLILPHGRPSDTLEWRLAHPDLKHDYWLRILITGIIEWERAKDE